MLPSDDKKARELLLSKSQYHKVIVEVCLKKLIVGNLVLI